MEKIKYIFLLFIILICSSVAMATEKAAENKPIKNHILLIPTNTSSEAKGFAEIFFKAKRQKTTQRFLIKVEKLSRDSLFTLWVNGIVIDTLFTNSGGSFEVTYETNPKGSHLPLPEPVTPVTQIKLVEVKDSSGRLVLNGNFVPISSDGCKSEELEQEISLFSTESTAPTPIQLGVLETKVVRENNIVVSQELRIKMEKLSPGFIFDLFVNNTHVASFTSRLDGKATIEFSDNPKRGELFLPPSLKLFPKVISVAVKNRANQPILLGSSENPLGNKIKYESKRTLGSFTVLEAKATLEIDVEIQKEKNEQEFELKIENVTPLSILKLFIDKKEVATLPIDNLGKSVLVMSSLPSLTKQPLPPLELILIQLIELKTVSGDTILTSAINLGNCEINKERREITLLSTGFDQDASGKSEITTERQGNLIIEQEFSIKVENLDKTTTYRLFVNNDEIMTFATNNQGSTKVEFSSKPKGSQRALPIIINPVNSIQLVEIRTLAGQTVLMGRF